MESGSSRHERWGPAGEEGEGMDCFLRDAILWVPSPLLGDTPPLKDMADGVLLRLACAVRRLSARPQLSPLLSQP